MSDPIRPTPAIPWQAQGNPWTLPLPDDVPISAEDTAAAIGQMQEWTASGNGWWINGGHDGPNFSQSVYVMPLDTPLTSIELDNPATSAAAERLRTALAAGVPLPDGWDDGFDPRDTDRTALVAQRQDDGAWRYWELYLLVRDPDTAAVRCSWGAFLEDSRANPGIFTDRTGAQATSLSAYSGLMLDEELRAGVIPHTLGFTAPNSLGYRWPAQRTDAGGGAGGALEAGMRLRVDPTLTLPDLDDPTATATRNAILVALQTYGMLVVDNSGDSNRVLKAENTEDPFDWGGVATDMLATIPDDSWQVIDKSWRPEEERGPMSYHKLGEWAGATSTGVAETARAVTVDRAIPAGTVLIGIGASRSMATSQNVTDAKGNTWAQRAWSASFPLSLYTCKVTTPLEAGDAITLRSSPARTVAFKVIAYAGLDDFDAVSAYTGRGTFNGGVGFTFNVSFANVTTTTDEDLLIAAVATWSLGGFGTVPPGYGDEAGVETLAAAVTEDTALDWATAQAGSAGVQSTPNGVHNTANSWASAVLALRPAPPGDPTGPTSLLLLGAG